MKTDCGFTNTKRLFIPFRVLLLCCATMSASFAGGNARYDADSWKTLIGEDCESFYDGCNNCRRTGGSASAACTRKACETYQEPRCLDQPVSEGSAGTTPFEGRPAKFACGGGKRFRVYCGEYVSGDMRVSLAAT